jgi:hypothetical protein
MDSEDSLKGVLFQTRVERTSLVGKENSKVLYMLEKSCSLVNN